MGENFALVFESEFFFVGIFSQADWKDFRLLISSTIAE